jgi:hypothetical protein
MYECKCPSSKQTKSLSFILPTLAALDSSCAFAAVTNWWRDKDEAATVTDEGCGAMSVLLDSGERVRNESEIMKVELLRRRELVGVKIKLHEVQLRGAFRARVGFVGESRREQYGDDVGHGLHRFSARVSFLGTQNGGNV